jgi:hypothetical protein
MWHTSPTNTSPLTNGSLQPGNAHWFPDRANNRLIVVADGPAKKCSYFRMRRSLSIEHIPLVAHDPAQRGELAVYHAPVELRVGSKALLAVLLLKPLGCLSRT